MSRAVVSIKRNGKGSGKSGLTRYIAESKRDAEREGLGPKETRPLFTAIDDRLTFSAANQHISRGNGTPTNEDIIHLVISPEMGQFDRLGLTREERKEKFREVTRATMREIEKELGVKDLHWAAGIHLNTDKPHTHVAIDRDAVDSQTGLPVRIEHLPRRLLGHNERQADGSKVFVPGRIEEVFLEELQRQRTPVRAIHVQTRAQDLEITREVVTPRTLSYRPPYPSERLVGDWVLAEIACRQPNLSGERRAELEASARALRAQVEKLDRQAEERGAKPAAAFVEPERLEALLREPPKGLTVRAYFGEGWAEELAAERAPATARAEGDRAHDPEPNRMAEGRDGSSDVERASESLRSFVEEINREAKEREGPPAEHAAPSEPTPTLLFEESKGEHVLTTAAETGARAPDLIDLASINWDEMLARDEPATEEHEAEFSLAPDAHELSEGPDREPRGDDWKDRYVLGRAMVARANYERLRDEHRSATEHGDKRRFLVYDETWGRTRRVSEFDVRRRSDARAGREAYERGIADPVRRQEERHSRFEGEIERHEKAIHDHRVILDKTVKKLEEKLKTATSLYEDFHPRAQATQARYGAEGRALPLPIVTREELREIQDRAVAARLPGRVQKLEEIRRGLAAEHNVPSRTDEERARLAGQLLLARAEHAARQSRVDSFEKSHHVQRFDVAGRKVSLADIDRQIAEASDRSQVFGRRVHLLPSGRREARAEVERLAEVREQVLEQIEARREEAQKEVATAARMVGVLGEIHRHDLESRAARGHGPAGRELTRRELDQLEQHALQTKDATLLRQFYLLEAEHEDRLGAGRKPTLERQAARVFGREVVGEISLAEAREQLENFEGRMQFVPVAVKDSQGRERTARLWDFREGTSPLVRVFDRLLESREQRETRLSVEQAVREQHAALRNECARAEACLGVTREVGAELRGSLREEGRTEPPAAFTPKQIIQVEMYAARHHEAGERARLEGLIRAAEEGGHVLAGEQKERKSPAEDLGRQAQSQSEITLEQEATRASAGPDRVHDYDEHGLLH